MWCVSPRWMHAVSGSLRGRTLAHPSHLAPGSWTASPGSLFFPNGDRRCARSRPPPVVQALVSPQSEPTISCGHRALTLRSVVRFAVWRGSACGYRYKVVKSIDGLIWKKCRQGRVMARGRGFIAPSPLQDKRSPPVEVILLGVVPFDWEVDGAAKRIFRAATRP